MVYTVLVYPGTIGRRGPKGGENTPRRGHPERQANTGPCTESESREGSEEEEEEEERRVDSGAPSRLRTGVWSVVGRAIDSLIGGGNGNSDGAQIRSTSRSEEETDDSEQEATDHPNGRPPTDAELRARMRTADSPLSKSGSKHTSRAGMFVGGTSSSQAGGAADAEPPPTTGQVTVKVPISLTPMQPPPDVVAAMKGRASLGGRRPRFSTPPDDVAAALERTREAKNRGHSNAVDLGAAHGEEGNCETRHM